jgi:hypothetical protein
MDQLTICNMALAHIAQGAITSIDGADKGAKHCKLWYDTIRDSLLQDHPWGFALKTAELTATATEPLAWEVDYDQPADALRILEILPEGGTSFVMRFVNGELQYVASGQDKVPYEIVGTQIQTNLSDAYAVYTAQITAEASFSLGFVEAFAWKLAQYIAMPVTGKFAVRDKAEAGFNTTWARVTSKNANERFIPRDQAGQCDIIQARTNG